MDKKDVPRMNNPSNSIEALEEYITERDIVGFVFNEFSVGEIEFWGDGELGHALTIWNGRESGEGWDAIDGFVVSDMDDKSTITWYAEECSGEINMLLKYRSCYTPPNSKEREDIEYRLRPLFFK